MKDSVGAPRPQLRRQRPAEMPVGRYFAVRSKRNGLILGVAEGEHLAGGHVVMREDDKGEDKPRLGGLWYEDCLTGTIRSRLGKGDLCLDVDGKRSRLSKRVLKLSSSTFLRLPVRPV